MLDIRLIREQPDFVKSRLATRGGDDGLARIDEVLRVDAERRKAETALQQLNADRKRLSKEIGGTSPQSARENRLDNWFPLHRCWRSLSDPVGRNITHGCERDVLVIDQIIATRSQLEEAARLGPNNELH